MKREPALRSRPSWFGWLVALPLSVGVACGPPPPPKGQAEKNVKTLVDEQSPDKLLARGKAFYAAGDLTRAEQYYAAALQAGAPESEVLPLLLRVCVEASRFQVAIEYAEPILKRHPENWKLRMVVGSLYAAVGQNVTARTHYETVVEQHPDEPTAHYALAVLLRDQFVDKVGADAHFREYLRLAPLGPHADEAKGSLLKPVKPEAPAPPAPANGTAVAPSSAPPSSSNAPPSKDEPKKLPGKDGKKDGPVKLP